MAIQIGRQLFIHLQHKTKKKAKRKNTNTKNAYSYSSYTCNTEKQPRLFTTDTMKQKRARQKIGWSVVISYIKVKLGDLRVASEVQLRIFHEHLDHLPSVLPTRHDLPTKHRFRKRSRHIEQIDQTDHSHINGPVISGNNKVS